MPIFTIQVDGHKLRIQAPDEATALSEANAWKPEKAKPSGPVFNPGKDAMRAIRPVLDRGTAAIENLRQGKPVDALDNPLLSAPLALLQAVTNQVTGPASRGAGRSALPNYEAPPAPWEEGFGKPVKRLEGEARDLAFEDVLNTALMGVRSVSPLRVGPPKPAPTRVKATPAEKKVGAALERAITRDGMTPMEVIANTEKGVPSFHAGGENLTKVAETAAQSPGPARTILRQAARDYSATAPTRTKADIGKSLGGKGDYLETLDTLIATRKTDARTGMKAIEKAPVKLTTDSIAALRSDLARTAIKDRVKNAAASPDADIRASADRLKNFEEMLAAPEAPAITVRDAQDISRALQQSATAEFRQGRDGTALADLGKSIRQNARQKDLGGLDEYDAWLKKYGDDISNEEALDLGVNVFKKENSAAAIRKQLKDASDAEKDLFRKGVGEALLDRVRQKGDVAELRGLMKNEEFGDRVALAFPDDASFAGFMESAAKRVAQQDRNNQVFGGSPTDSRIAARADLEADGGDAADIAVDFATLDAKSLGKRALKAGMKRKAPSILSDPKMNEMLGKAMSDPDQLTALLNLLQAARASSAYRASVAQRAALPALTTAAAQPEN